MRGAIRNVTVTSQLYNLASTWEEKKSLELPPSNNSVIFCGIENILIKPDELSL